MERGGIEDMTWNICRNCDCDWENCGRHFSCTANACEDYVIGVNVNLSPPPCGCTNWQPINKTERNELRQFDRENP